jgi:hypothetical protein
MTEEGNDALQDAADDVIERLQRNFGERWGGAWLRWEPTREICIAVVDPTAEEANLVARAADAAEWVGTTVAVRYSWVQLEAFQEQLRLASNAESIVMLWPDATLNKICVTLNAFDLDALRRLYDTVPSDVLVVSVHPGVHAELLGGGRRTSEAG